MLRADTGVVVEVEPNDSVDQAHPLTDLYPGSWRSILGHLSSSDDPLDGFSLRCPLRTRVTATLTYAVAAGAALELSLYSPVGMQFVRTFDASTSPATATFDLKGSADLVVRALAGATDYVLTLSAEVSPSSLVETEPDDTSLEAAFAGEIVPGDAVRFVGSVGPTDLADGWIVPCPAAVRLSVSLDVPAFENFDVEVLDATADLANPASLASFASTTADPETGSVDVAAGTLLVVRVLATSGSGSYALSVQGTAPVAPQGVEALTVPRPVAALATEGRIAHGGAPAAPYGRARTAFRTGEALVRFRDREADRARSDVTARGGRVAEELSAGVRLVRFDVPGGLTEEEGARFTVARVRALAPPSVAYAEPNRVRHVLSTEPNDTYYPLQWHYSLIRLPEAWDLTTGSSNVVVAVLDTGKTGHPDLAGRWLDGYDFVSSGGLDGNGRDADPTDPGNGGYPFSASYHGTHVAGTIGALTNNGTGVAGVAWNVRLMPVRVLSDYGGSDADIAEGIRYAARLQNASGTLPSVRANVINMSLGGPGFSQTMADATTAARAAGVVVVAAAGNAGTSVPNYPASNDGVISVGAVDALKHRTAYSSYGPTLDLMAPGGDSQADRNGDGYGDGVLSTVYDDASAPPVPTYAFYDGTSMATPHVAGVAALLFSVNPALTPAEVEGILLGTAEDLGAAGRDDLTGYGLVDAYAAVLAAQVEPVPPPDQGPPRLGLFPDTLLFSNFDAQQDVEVRNLGGGLLTVGPLDVTTSDGGSWLAAQPSGGDGTRTASTIRVTVDRTGLPPGAYAGTIVVHSDGGDGVVRVAMTALLLPPPPPDAEIHVRAVRADTGQVVQEQVVSPNQTLSWTFPTLPAGRYFFVAGTDFDGDGVIGEEGDLYGRYPDEAEPRAVDVVAGTSLTFLDFSVERKQGFAAAAAPGP